MTATEGCVERYSLFKNELYKVDNSTNPLGCMNVGTVFVAQHYLLGDVALKVNSFRVYTCAERTDASLPDSITEKVTPNAKSKLKLRFGKSHSAVCEILMSSMWWRAFNVVLFNFQMILLSNSKPICKWKEGFKFGGKWMEGGISWDTYPPNWILGIIIFGRPAIV